MCPTINKNKPHISIETIGVSQSNQIVAADCFAAEIGHGCVIEELRGALRLYFHVTALSV